EVAAAWYDTRRGGLDNGFHSRNFKIRLVVERCISDCLSRQRTLDENYLATGMRDAAALLVQRFNPDHGHYIKRRKSARPEAEKFPPVPIRRFLEQRAQQIDFTLIGIRR